MFQIGRLLPIAINILQIFFQLSIVTTFFMYRRKRRATLLCGAVLGLLTFPNPWMTLAAFFLGVFACYFFVVGMRLPGCLAAIAAHYALTCLISNLLALLSFLASPTSAAPADTAMELAALTLYALIYGAVTRLRISMGQQIQGKAIALLILFLFPVSVLSCYARDALRGIAEIPRSVQIMICLLCLLIQVTAFFVLLRMNQYLTRIERLELQQLYIDTLESAHNKLMGFKHDFNNILNTMAGYVSLRKYDMLGDYIHKLQNETVLINTADVANTNLKEAPFLYGVILSKLAIAEIQGVQLYLNVMATVFHVNTLHSVELSRIMGILLDNALEAALDSEDKYISVDLMNRAGRLEIAITNPFAGEIEADRLFSRGYSTKENHTGYGLYEVRQTLNRYRDMGMDVFFDVRAEGGLFTAHLVV